jgi:hypothetical protein
MKCNKGHDRIIVKCVKENPGNIGQAMKRASELTGRTPAALTFVWYNRIKKDKKVFKIEAENSVNNSKNFNSYPQNIIEVRNGSISIGSTLIKGDFTVRLSK